MAANSSSAVKMASDGLWQGENPLDFALPLLAIQVAVILVVTQGLAFALKPLRQPRVVAEILVYMLPIILFEDLVYTLLWTTYMQQVYRNWND